MKLPKAKKCGAIIPTASMADIAFLLIVFFSPDGLLGLWERWKAHMAKSGRSLSSVRDGEG